MRIRFSVIAFVPPNAQLGVVGSAPFLGAWKLDRCVPLVPYSAPHPQGLEPSLWFRDIDLGDPGCVAPSSPSSGEANDAHASAGAASACGNACDGLACGHQSRPNRHCLPAVAPPKPEFYPGDCGFAVELLTTSQRAQLNDGSHPQPARGFSAADPRLLRCSFFSGCALASVAPSSTCSSPSVARAATKCVWDAATFRVATRAPEVQALLERHPLRHAAFEYKFVLWYPASGENAVPYVPATAGEDAPTTYAGGHDQDPEDANGGRDGARSWREWLFPPLPSRCPSPPQPADSVVWEGCGPSNNRKFSFDPYDVVVDVNEGGNLESLYMCRIAHFRDPRAGGTGEYELTTRFYNAVKSECRMHYSTIFPRFFVGSCPRQLKHIRHLKEDLKVTCVVNLQTEQDLCNNYPDPIASSRSAEAVSHLYDGSGLRYVWLPTADMCDSARKIAVANAAFLILGLFQNGHSVYVHCNAGVGRSIAAACAFLCFAVGLDLRKANFLISAKRPVAYWDEKAMKYGLGDYQAKFGRCRVTGEDGREDRRSAA
ncbi:serine/threonine specific protein phosphatase [Besnoitia besnoiti]|uniref:Serine/threonine specific protein phosphatase n=1 Tax=Besnoitia besnoiti TaxID=94643 RepID=A0A2A9M6L0_BESBE|nr:serine/threonine specific protein phosphatase [Besnoitia besnoiti]PFH31050.1 serine/threonine specific protein phosphatase [Besnoitia besnoiti]